MPRKSTKKHKVSLRLSESEDSFVERISDLTDSSYSEAVRLCVKMFRFMLGVQGITPEDLHYGKKIPCQVCAFQGGERKEFRREKLREHLREEHGISV